METRKSATPLPIEARLDDVKNRLIAITEEDTAEGSVSGVDQDLYVGFLRKEIEAIDSYAEASNLLLAIARSLYQYSQVATTKKGLAFGAIIKEFYEAAILLGNSIADDEWTDLKKKPFFTTLEKTIKKWNTFTESKPSLPDLTQYLSDKLDEYLEQISIIKKAETSLILAYLFYNLAKGVYESAFLGRGIHLFFYNPGADDLASAKYTRLTEARVLMHHAQSLGHPKADKRVASLSGLLDKLKALEAGSAPSAGMDKSRAR